MREDLGRQVSWDIPRVRVSRHQTEQPKLFLRRSACCLPAVLNFIFLIAFKPRPCSLNLVCISMTSFLPSLSYTGPKYMSRKETRRHEKDCLRGPKPGVSFLKTSLHPVLKARLVRAGGERARGWIQVLTLPQLTMCDLKQVTHPSGYSLPHL